MNELITINYDSERPTVSARDLHEFLEVGTQYTKWFDRMCEYGFTENVDFIAISQKRLTAQGNETTYSDHQLTIEMAKELCMLQRNEKGKEARIYFLNLEKQWNSPEFVIARALKMANEKISKLELTTSMQEQQIAELKPKADYTDTILQSKSLVNVNQIAKDYGMSSKTMNKLLSDKKVQYKQGNQWLLYSKHQSKGYTSSETINITRSDGSPDVVMRTKWTQKGRLFIYELLKKDNIRPLIEQKL